MSPPADPAVALLRHAVATVAYRGGKAVRGAPDSFAEFSAGGSTRTPSQILAHVGDLFDWALSLRGESRRGKTPAASVESGSRPLPRGPRDFDAHLRSGSPSGSPPKTLPGPGRRRPEHVGQLTILRRLAGSPVRGENYHRAEIEAGRLGENQAAPRREFD